ncbi:OLC1v1037087C1 [Oldenlandia corymbosa var. corymbosa]|uniref:OLC1v1037087C1 n=1 Tax=Oldenlandia corymbosa var. corymbosa TaxID=529605 RepID=A0AAV1CXH9_OLDCO|nr:OLC1v1037087C1 [Oldenlandia corymbosa var. corymbosa]
MNVFCFIVVIIGSICHRVAPEAQVHNVLNYGALGFNFFDNSHAFLAAWNAACNANTGTSKVVVPENMVFLVFPVTFQGPCKPDKIIFTVSGTILAPNGPSMLFYRGATQWLVFNGVKGLTVEGNGHVDGQGNYWWGQSCKISPQLEGCTYFAPTALQFVGCNESRLSNVRFTNSPQTHVLIMHCNQFRVNNLNIQAPDESPNTDGIHIQASHHVRITNSIIGSGDDCISIGDYTSNVDISNITCGPGHGISIGSLGKQGNSVEVSNIRVINSFFTGTTNGARIKTWQVGKGYVRHVIFENLRFNNVKNPIIIDQNYCDHAGACPELVNTKISLKEFYFAQFDLCVYLILILLNSFVFTKDNSGVKISDVAYRTMSGTSNTRIAINLNCSRFVHCTGISMQSIRLTSATAGEQVVASCNNARGRETDVVPAHCLQETSSIRPRPK